MECFVGRELQLQSLHAIFHRIGVSHASEAVMIHGSSGVGKSTLVDVFVKSLPKNALISRGKFEQLHCRTPFSTLVAITEHLCRKILRQENHEEIRDRIRGTLGSDLSLLGQLIPELSNMKTENLQFYGTLRSQNTSSCYRFTKLLQSFLRCVASEDNPVILFLDDTQWADMASIEILKSLLSDSFSHNMMIICAYRDDETCENFSQILNLSEAKKDTDGESFVWPISIIPLQKLELVHFNELISKTLQLTENETQRLSFLIWNKTNGNPFFASNFLDMLYARDMLSQQIDGKWNWDENRILLRTNVADNLAQILEVKLQRLPNHARSILQMASFIGYEFSLDILTIILFEEQDIIEVDYSFDRHSMESIQNQVSFALMLACDEGLLESISDAKKKAFKFAHDKIRQVLYEDLMPDSLERELLHQRIGFLVWEAFNVKQNFQALNDWAVFLAANNLNCALNVVDNLNTIQKTINVNLVAAKAAMTKSDFRLALEYLRVAIKLHEENLCWESQYELCVDLYSTAAEVEMINASYERCDILLSKLFQRATSLEDLFTAYQIQLNCLAGKGNIKESVHLGFDILRKLGLVFPKKISVLSVSREFLLVKVALGMKPLVYFLSLPVLTDRKVIYMLSIMDAITTNAFVLGDSFKQVCAFFIFRMLRMTMKYGLSAMYAPTAILSWGTGLALMGIVDKALEAKQVAFMVIEMFNAEAIKGQAIIIACSSIDVWRNRPDNESCKEILFAYHLARTAGDVFFAQFGIVIWIIFKTYLNDPLYELHPRIRAFVQELRLENARRALILIQPNWQFVSFLPAKIICIYVNSALVIPALKSFW
jgi:predicted ATPase